MRIAIWALFFATSVYGHLGLKIATDRETGIWAQATSPYAISAFVAWTASSVLWMRVLEHDTLLGASAISSLRFVLLVLAAGLFLREPIDPKAWAGCALIAAGVFLVTR